MKYICHLDNEMLSLSLQTFHRQDIPLIGELWQTLYLKANPNFFLSWPWMSAWLKTLPSLNKVYLLKIELGTQLVGLAFVVNNPHWLEKLLGIKKLYLNRTGEDKYDQIWIENNAILIDVSALPMDSHELLVHIVKQELVEKLVVNVANLTKISLSTLDNSSFAIKHQDSGYSVDLKRFANPLDYLTLLSKNTRYQINRTEKRLKEVGELTFECVEDASRKVELLTQYKHWHIEKWKNTSTPSGFANSAFEHFHHTLLDNKESKTALFVLYLNGEVIAITYCFFDSERCYFYLALVKPWADAKVKIGILSHYYIVQWLIKNRPDITHYDFLAGNARYKKSLSTDIQHYAVVEYHADTMRMKLVNALRALKK